MPDTFRNPLKEQGADPWLTFYDGFYYLSTTVGARLEMRKSATLGGLKDAGDVVIWTDDTPSRNSQMWAAEYYLLDGPHGKRWYCYYTASDGTDDAHRLFVLESAGLDPMGPYAFCAQVHTDPEDAFYCIDGSILQTSDGSLFFAWAGRPGHVLFVAPMSNPWTIFGPRVHLAADGFGCEEVREGPVFLRRHGQIFLVYSACDTGKPDYMLGMLVADENADVLDPSSWRQIPGPVFARNDDAGVFGPGHNFFFQSPDLLEDWIVYHAKTSSEYTYSGRSTRVQKFSWNADGFPVFGVPLALDVEIDAPSGERRAAEIR